MGTTHRGSSDPLIQRLEKEWLQHRDAAIRNNEGPQGAHRRHAEGLQRQIHELREAREARMSSPGVSPVLMGMAFMASITFGSSMWQAVLQAQKGMSSGGSADTTAAVKPKAPVQTIERPAAQPKSYPQSPQRTPDPALVMQGRFHGSKYGGSYAALDEGFNNYQRLSGTLARMQTLALIRRDRIHQLPTVWINRTRKDCFSRPSIGVYNRKCQVIKLDYTDGQSTYEHPVEMEVTLAHEWGHHLISLSEVSMSPTEQEVVSDCFAGAVFGYYARHGLIGEQDAIRSIKMMEYVGNNSAHGHHPNMETRIRSFVGGLYSVIDPFSAKAAEFTRSCASLHQVVNVEKIRQMGLTWDS